MRSSLLTAPRLPPLPPPPTRQAVGLDTQLTPASAPDYTLPEKPKPKEDTPLAPQFPWWFGFGVVSTAACDRGRGALGTVQRAQESAKLSAA